MLSASPNGYAGGNPNKKTPVHGMPVSMVLHNVPMSVITITMSPRFILCYYLAHISHIFLR